MTRQHVKLVILLIFFFFSQDALTQTTTNRQSKITSDILKGTWIASHMDSTFGHKSSLEFTFTKTGSFNHEYKLDGKIKEKYVGKFEISASNVLILKIPKKPSIRLEVIQISLNFLKIKEIGTKDVITLTRK